MQLEALPGELRDRALFLVWGPPSHGPRSRVLARALGIEVRFIYSVRGRGLLWAPLKYPYQAVATMWVLFRRRPDVVFVQSPPTFAPLFALLYCRLVGACFIIDAHSGAFQDRYWTWAPWLCRYPARQALTTMVTNSHDAETIRSWGGRATILRDVPTDFGVKRPRASPRDSFAVLVVSSCALDEPLAAVLDAATRLQRVTFYVTGDHRRADPHIVGSAPPNVHFTGFLPDRAYYQLMASSQAVMCLTLQDHTMQRGACEALSMGVPIITSGWPLLRSYFYDGTVHVDNSAAGIRDGVMEMMRNHARYQAGIQELQKKQQQEWEQALDALRMVLAEYSREGYEPIGQVKR